VREQDHVADGGRIGKEHDQAVDADTQTCRRRHAVLQRAHVVGVEEHRFLIAAVLARHLGTEARRLILRIVELGEAVGDLAPGEKELEAIGDERIGIIAP
jgi:hypothetical protein